GARPRRHHSPRRLRLGLRPGGCRGRCHVPHGAPSHSADHRRQVPRGRNPKVGARRRRGQARADRRGRVRDEPDEPGHLLQREGLGVRERHPR
ncbi:unnamed protein product, partial [Ectocarpus fasciculatus]